MANKMGCDICHEMVKEMYSCPIESKKTKTKYISVCRRCCEECDYHKVQKGAPLGFKCTYWATHENLERKLENLTRRANMMKNQIEKEYLSNRPRKAEELEGKINWVYEDIRNLEKKIKNDNI